MTGFFSEARLGWTAVALGTVLLLNNGCQQVSGRVHDDIGSTHVAVLSVTRFDDYKAQLQPVFGLKPEEALAQAIPDTRQFNEALFHAFRTKVGLKLAPSDVLPAGFGDGQAGSGVPAGNLGDAPTPGAEPVSVINPSALGSDKHLAYLAATALYQEVQLINRYITDAAIRGEHKAYIVRLQVANMPRVRQAAYDTYLDLGFFMEGVDIPVHAQPLRFHESDLANAITVAVRNQHASDINLDTLNKNQQFDKFRQEALSIKSSLEAKLSANADDTAAMQAAVNDLDRLKKSIQASSLSEPEMKVLSDAISTSYQAPIQNALSDLLLTVYPPIIIPLLVTDQIEASLAARRAEELSQLTLALSAAYAGIGGTIDTDSLDKAVRSAAGRDYNSLLTVGRLSDNTLRVRIGARHNGGDGESRRNEPNTSALTLSCQTHNVSLLVLAKSAFVDNIPRDIHIGARTHYVNARTGVEAPVRTDSQIQAALNDLAAKEWRWYDSGGNRLSFTPKELLLWSRQVQNQDRAGFLNSLAVQLTAKNVKLKNEHALANRIWSDLTTARVGSEYDKAVFTVPDYPTRHPVIVDESQTVIMVDNGKAVTATVFGVEYVDPASVSALWQFTVKDNGGSVDFILAANDAKITQGGRSLVLTFPSVAAMKLNGKPVLSTNKTLHITVPGSKHPNLVDKLDKSLRWLYQSTPATLSPIQSIVEPTAIQATAGDAESRSLLLRITNPKGSTKVLATIRGGIVKTFKLDGTPISPKADGLQVYEIAPEKNYIVELTQVVEDSKVTVTLKDTTESASDQSVEVKVSAAPKK